MKSWCGRGIVASTARHMGVTQGQLVASHSNAQLRACRHQSRMAMGGFSLLGASILPVNRK